MSKCASHKCDTGFNLDAATQDVVCSLHLATLTHIWAEWAHSGSALSRCNCIGPRAMVFGQIVHFCQICSLSSKIQ